MENPTEDRILRYPEVIGLIGAGHRMTVERWIREGKFPRPFKITEGGRACGWRYSTIMKWIAERGAEATR